MKTKLLIICSMLSITLFSQINPINQSIQKSISTIKDAFAKIYKYDSIPGDPFHFRVYTLPNGLRVYLSEYHVQPRIQTMIAVKAGSKYDPSDATGLAHYLEHMLFKGTDNFGTKNYEKEKPLLDNIENLFETYRQTKDITQRKYIYHQIDSISFVAAKYAIANEYDKMASAIGATGTNAFTANDETVYVNDIPANQIDNWLTMESERFRNPVFRLFHTELEAVYEEKNRSLDNDRWHAYEVLMKELFSNHPYGTQTTIGTIEHLKNPSLKEIRKYFNKYYVPNNMAIIMCGDFNPDSVIIRIYQHFAGFQAKPIEPIKQITVPELTQKIQKTVYGPNSEFILMSWKLDGASSIDAQYLSLLSNLLSNEKSGLLDINVNQKQKVLNSSANFWTLKDYSMLNITGEPKEGQSLEDVEKIILEQIENIKKGNFDEQLLKDIITNKKLEEQKMLEENQSRAFNVVDAFSKDVPLQQIVNNINYLKKITKQDIMHFVQERIKPTNYVVVYKKTGKDTSILKVTKPTITPVEVDRKNTSAFTKNIMESTPTPIIPKFIDFNKDINKSILQLKTTSTTTKPVTLLYNQNKENDLFELIYLYTIDASKIKDYSVLNDYLSRFPQTNNLTTEMLNKKLYQLGCNIEYFLLPAEGQYYLKISGLSENMTAAMNITNDILNSLKIDKETFDQYINDIITERSDNKKDKNYIQYHLRSYAIYGKDNQSNDVYNNNALKKLNKDSLVLLVKTLTTYPQEILYYGPLSKNKLSETLTKTYILSDKSKKPTEPKVYSTETVNKGGQVFYIPYDMQQAEFNIISKLTNYDYKLTPYINMFNSYFGGSMSGVVFQEIRESKALAYASSSYVQNPINLKYPYFSISYVGTQADKLPDALPAMWNLLDSLPYNEASFNAAKESIIQNIRTSRIIKTSIFFTYLNAKRLNLDHDVRKDVFEAVPKMQFKDLQKFHQQYISKKPRNISIIGDESKINFNTLSKYGSVKKLSLEDIFGY